MDDKILIEEVNKHFMIEKIDKHLESPTYPISLYRRTESMLREDIKKGSRLVIFIFKDLESLLFRLEGKGNNEDKDVECLCLPWSKWNSFPKIELGKHKNIMDQARKTIGGVAIMIIAGDHCCSVTAIKVPM